jgi:hypothetical protein
MNCVAAREMMLVADLAELEGTTESDLGRHVRGCADCAAAAQRILAAEQELGRAMRNVAPRRAADEAIRRARDGAPRTRWVWRAAPLAAAAALAAVLLWHRPLVDHVLPSTMPPALDARLAVEAPPGRSVAVFRTDNPDIVVIWFF